MTAIEKFLKDRDSDDQDLPSAISDFLDDLITEFGSVTHENQQKVKDLLLAKQMLAARGASVKMILEFVAVMI